MASKYHKIGEDNDISINITHNHFNWRRSPKFCHIVKNYSLNRTSFGLKYLLFLLVTNILIRNKQTRKIPTLSFLNIRILPSALPNNRLAWFVRKMGPTTNELKLKGTVLDQTTFSTKSPASSMFACSRKWLRAQIVQDNERRCRLQCCLLLQKRRAALRRPVPTIGDKGNEQKNGWDLSKKHHYKTRYNITKKRRMCVRNQTNISPLLVTLKVGEKTSACLTLPLC